MKNQKKLLETEIGELQSELPKEKDIKAFEALRRKIDLLEIKRVQLINPIENEKPLTTFKILTK
jgi:hypothetical protein